MTDQIIDSSTATARDTINIDKSVHDIYKTLTDSSADAEQAPFRTMKDVFMWAVSLGYARGEKKPLKSKEMIFRWAQFSPQIDVPLLKAIAIADSGCINVLASQADILAIAEEYANAGIHDLCAQLMDEHGHPLWNLVGLL